MLTNLGLTNPPPRPKKKAALQCLSDIDGYRIYVFSYFELKLYLAMVYYVFYFCTYIQADATRHSGILRT